MSRIGKFYVSSFLVNNHKVELSQILSFMEFIPTNVYFEYAIDKFIYTGYSKLFDEQIIGEIIPEYAIQITNQADDTIHVSVYKV